MKKGQRLSLLLRSEKTVFSTKDVFLLWEGGSRSSLSSLIRYYVKRGELLPIRRGLYARDQHYRSSELATKILVPSYISFETVLAAEGLTFQWYDRVFVASYATRDIVCQGKTFSFKKMPRRLLADPSGLEHRDESTFATKERAFLDTLFIHTNYHFDNLSPLDWEVVFSILPIYQNRRLEHSVQTLHADFLSQK